MSYQFHYIKNNPIKIKLIKLNSNVGIKALVYFITKKNILKYPGRMIYINPIGIYFLILIFELLGRSFTQDIRVLKLRYYQNQYLVSYQKYKPNIFLQQVY